MIARPKISQNEWKPAEIGAFEVGNFALLSCPARDHRRGDDRQQTGEEQREGERPKGLDPEPDGEGHDDEAHDHADDPKGDVEARPDQHRRGPRP